METITRKKLLYRIGAEYGANYGADHVFGCSHGCKYPCWAFVNVRYNGRVKTYDEWVEPKIVSNALELLDKEIPRLKDKIESVQLCCLTDPFMYGVEEVTALSLAVIKKLNDNQVKATILTKGILPGALADFDKKNEYGISLVSLNEDYRKENEPGAAPYQKRIESLKYLHDTGCKTFVSIEPYPTPNMLEQDLSEILTEISFADKITFSKFNYNMAMFDFRPYKKFYNECSKLITDFCESQKIVCHIKRGTFYGKP